MSALVRISRYSPLALARLFNSVSHRASSSWAIATVRVRGDTLKKLAELSAFYFREEVEIDPKAAGKWLTGPSLERLKKLGEALASLPEFDEASLAAVFERMAAEEGIKMTEIAQPVRVAMTGSTASPGIYEVLSVLGKERALRRLHAAISKG